MRINTPWKLVAVAFLQLCIYFWYFAPSQTLPRCSLCFPSPTRNGTSEYTLKINKTHISCFMYVTQSPKKAPLFLTLLCADWLTDARIETFLVVQSVHCIFEFVDYPAIPSYPWLSSELVRSCSEFSDILALWGENLAYLVQNWNWQVHIA